ncbi:DNA replication ATP-dependent helicase/nuclease DNA2-like [Palaemon carinicauda]|uniref:DNA replication ATP-dependent helicase/nuclease DNA2-like n=1 Tax=Palaemon carinicauda TaxID=392227 RepID=UPI0035B5D95A
MPLVRKLSQNRKVSPNKNNGQKKISSYFTPATTSKLFTTVNDEVSKKSYQKSTSSQIDTKKSSVVSKSKQKSIQKSDINSQGLTDVSSDSDVEIVESQPTCIEETKKCVVADDDDFSPEFIPPTPKMKARDKILYSEVQKFHQDMGSCSKISNCNEQGSEDTSFDSETDAIEGTPEVSSKFNRFLVDDTLDNDDIIPPTPQHLPSLGTCKSPLSKRLKYSRCLPSSRSLNVGIKNDLKPKPLSLKSKDTNKPHPEVQKFHQDMGSSSKISNCNEQGSEDTSFDSETDAIESTPEVSSKFKRFLVDDTLDNDDIIPPTPQHLSSLSTCKSPLRKRLKYPQSLLSSRSLNVGIKNDLKPKPLSLKSTDTNKPLPEVQKFRQDMGSSSKISNCNEQGLEVTSFDSEIDVIEGTPEASSKFKRSIVDESFDDDDIIPPTPEPKPVRKFPLSRRLGYSQSVLGSRSLNGRINNDLKPKPVSLKSKDTSKPHLLKANDKPLQVVHALNNQIPVVNEPGNNDEIASEKISLSICDKENKNVGMLGFIKSAAITGTGVSSDPKRVITQDKIKEINDINQCKLNLFAKFSHQSPSLSGSESDGSFSLLQGSVISQKAIKKDVKNSNMLIEEVMKNEDNEITDNSMDELVLLRNGITVTDNRAVDSEDDMQQVSADKEIKLKTGKDIFEMSQEFVIESSDGKEEISKDKSTFPEADFEFEDSLDYLLGEDLASNFEKMSPFKKPESAQTTENKIINRMLNEGLGEDSFAVRSNFGRHIVTGVEHRPYEGQMFIQMTSLHEKEKRTCSLRGFWVQSAIAEGDIVHILFAKYIDGHYTIDNNQGIIVIKPDYLISGTSVVSAVFCRRKSVLNERFRGMDSGNKAMLIGSLVHQLFQDVVKNKITSKVKLDSLMRQLISHPKMLCEMYGLGVNEAGIFEEMNNYLPRILSWSQRYLGSGLVQMQDGCVSRKNQWQGNILEIHDIEENIWSPKFGVKGKVDLTVKTRCRGSTKVVPLELKTGRSSFSAEHRGQVTLYSMMSADRREDPQAGLLLYLKDGAMEEVPAGEKEKKGLIQLRNEMIHYLTAQPVFVEGNNVPKSPNLPEPITFEKACSKCAHLLTCTVYQKHIEEVTPDPAHPMATLIPQATGHLKQSHLDYFRLWCLLLHLEIAVNKKDNAVRSLWCQNADKREAMGDCLSFLILDPSCEVQEYESGCFLHTFIRSPSYPSQANLEDVGIQTSESVVISSKLEIALCLGIVSSFKNGGVCITMDRNLKDYPNWRNKIFSADRCEYQNTMSINFTNLSRLLMDTPRATTLRSQIIEKTVPSFKKGLPQEVVTKGKHILKRLNKIQQRSVLKTLMAEDYSLLMGFPGTGKTSTIVALVDLMVALGHSVLLTSYTHSAVDNILLKLKALNVDFLRLGKLARIHPDLISYADEKIIKDFKDVASLSEFYANKLVVASTCLGANHVIFTKRTFDFCIVDEASQVLQTAALGPLFHASRFVLVGDPKQLPPVIQSSQARDLGMGESLFMRLDSMGATFCLTDQYRMNGQIMKLANFLMYEGQLRCANTELEEKTVDLPQFQELIATSDVVDWVRIVLDPSIEHSVVFMDTCGGAPEERSCAKMVINSRETSCVLILIKTLLKAGLSADDIGVITPYRAQVKNISTHVKKEVELGHRVEVNTVDQYQGRDKSVIIYSCVRSGILQAEAGEILQDERRLNVAITRAKYKLIMIGDMATLQLFKPFKKLTSILESSQIYKMKEGSDGFSWSDSILS